MPSRLAGVASGVVAVGSKELRGRMRGPRAFIALTFYLVLLAGFTVMIYLLQQQAAAQQAAFGGGNPYVSAQVGQAIFMTLLFLQVLLVVFLAPAATSGAISLEREKQTLNLLAATPVSTIAIVLGKLSSALAFVVVLVLASIPLTAVVFVFGGVAPEDILRGYAVLLVTALGFGSVGILVSSMTRRTQSATILTYLAVLVLTVGTGFAWFFWDQMAGPRTAAIPMIEERRVGGEVPALGAAPARPRRSSG
jgi:ABC-2 type transport system permease protein